MLPDRVPNPGPLTYESSALPFALRGSAVSFPVSSFMIILSVIGENRNMLQSFYAL